EDSQRDLPSPCITCPKDSQVFGFHHYSLFHIPQTWINTELSCQKRPSGHMGEASRLSALVSRVNNHQYLIELHDPTLGEEPNGRGWQWSNTNVLNYFNWNPSTALDHGYCGSLTKSSRFLQWRDFHCDVKFPCVCKFKA
uniref:C-type lectin domain-containing protein n=1 Tax=Jaculus jaculus TaxID=51337 RepID=A0A8C5NV54_JACJA